MNPLHHPLTVSIVFATIACGPPRVGAAPDEDQGGSEATATEATSDSAGSEATTEEPMDPEATSTWTTADFVPQQDVFELVECDPLFQDCPEGEKCVAYASTGGNWDANKCVPVMGEQKPGEPCWYGGTVEATDNCDETSACWEVMDVDGELVGTCYPYCTGAYDRPECPAKWKCMIWSNGATTTCIPTCDPLEQDCGPLLACYWTNSAFHCIFTTEDIPAGEPCGFINDCASGNMCMAAESLPACAGSACCAAFCDLGLGDGQCGAVPGTSCVPFFEEGAAPPGYDLVGVCVSP